MTWKTQRWIIALLEMQGETWTQIGELLRKNENEETGRHVSMAIDGSVFSCSKLHHFDDGSTNGEVVILQEDKTGGILLIKSNNLKE